MQQVVDAQPGPETLNVRGVAPLLAFVAGYVDATTFLAFNGLFVAQATGSLVVASSAFETGAVDTLKVAAIPVFVTVGVATAALVRRFGIARDTAFATVLTIEAVLVACLTASGLLWPSNPLVAGLFGLAAMGVQSALARLLLSSGSTNVMTTNLTQFATDLEAALATFVTRKSDHAALTSLLRIGAVILGFCGGVAVGSFGFHVTGMAGVALMVAVLVAMALRVRQRSRS